MSFSSRVFSVAVAAVLVTVSCSREPSAEVPNDTKKAPISTYSKEAASKAKTKSGDASAQPHPHLSEKDLEVIRGELEVMERYHKSFVKWVSDQRLLHQPDLEKRIATRLTELGRFEDSGVSKDRLSVRAKEEAEAEWLVANGIDKMEKAILFYVTSNGFMKWALNEEDRIRVPGIARSVYESRPWEPGWPGTDEYDIAVIKIRMVLEMAGY